ncbi:MAG: hypothetical protein IPM92_02660 [Saprospiraceae bacterium]|nr:hypothetical protein [Saprospiraceae bacterium]
MFGTRKKRSLMENMSAIASILSATIVCVRLTYFGILPIETAALIMVAVVFMAAVGTTVMKLGICAASIYLFAKYVSQGDDAQFQGVLAAILALIIALIGLYIIVRQMFR